SAGAFDSQSGVWTLSRSQLAGLQLTPADDSDSDFSLTVTATATESANAQSSASTTAIVNVTVTAVADVPEVSGDVRVGVVRTEDVGGVGELSAALTDTDSSEWLRVVVSGLPSNATIDGADALGSGAFDVSSLSLAGLVIVPPYNSDDSFTVTVTA